MHFANIDAKAERNARDAQTAQNEHSQFVELLAQSRSFDPFTSEVCGESDIDFRSADTKHPIVALVRAILTSAGLEDEPITHADMRAISFGAQGTLRLHPLAPTAGLDEGQKAALVMTFKDRPVAFKAVDDDSYVAGDNDFGVLCPQLAEQIVLMVLEARHRHQMGRAADLLAINRRYLTRDALYLND